MSNFGLSDYDSWRPLNCSFESTEEVEGRIEYIIRLSVPHISALSWTLRKRYNDFVALHDIFGSLGLPLDLPPKKAFGNKDREFIGERQRALEVYFGILLENLYVLSCKPLKQFLHGGPRLGDQSNSAGQLMAMVFRTDNRFELTGNLPLIGWRCSKEFASVRKNADPKEKLVACWSFYGPDRAALPSDVSAFLQSLGQIDHPLFYPLVFADARDTGCVCVHPQSELGSLLDIIKNVKFRQVFPQKYVPHRRGKGLSTDEVQRYGRQILEVLKFFHDNSIPFGNLSSRNVIIDGGRARVCEIESGICGFRSFFWPFIVQFRRINTFEAIDVYCFGHLLYEMVFGLSLGSPTCDNISPACPPLLRAVLESILTPEACKVGMPTVSQLLTQPFFHNVILNYDKATMKMSRKLKESLLDAKTRMEARIVQEQKLYHAYRKEVKVHSIQSSEDEKRKRRLMALKSQISPDTGSAYNGVNGRASTPDLANTATKSVDASMVETLMDTKGKMPSSLNSAPRSPPPPPPPPSVSAGSASKQEDIPPTVDGNERSALLASIRGFSKNKLAQAQTNDKSSPIIS